MSETKIVIESQDGKKKIEFSQEEFNKSVPIKVTKIEYGEVKEVRHIRFTNNRLLIMN